MARTAVATLQTVWDCRWSQPGHRPDVINVVQPESRWMCTRDGGHRSVDEHECETCAYWERADEAVTWSRSSAALTAHAPAAAVADRPRTSLDVAARIVALLTAVVLAASGFTILTGPLMIPFVVVLWLGAAAFGAFTFFGRFPEAERREDAPHA